MVTKRIFILVRGGSPVAAFNTKDEAEKATEVLAENHSEGGGYVKECVFWEDVDDFNSACKSMLNID